MAFVCTAGQSSTHADAFKREGNEYTVLSHVGYDDADGTNYYIMVGLSLAGGGRQEFHFSFVESICDNGEHYHHDGRTVARIVARAYDRQAIMAAILVAARSLIAWAAPEVFFMSTYDEYLPQTALQKYLLLNELFTSCGYEVSEPDTYRGRHLWWAERYV